MPSVRSLLLRHGYAFLFCYVFGVQAGVPIPADPLLLIMGALVGDGRYSFWISAVAGITAAMAGDCFWYELGRRRGRSVLAVVCKLSLEPDACVRKTELRFRRRGAWSLLVAKFFPGMSLVSMPLAGVIQMRRWRFLLADAAGCALWVFGYLLLGKLFHRQIDSIISLLGFYGQRAGIIVASFIALYVAFKYLQRWRFRRQLRINRVSPQEALNLMSGGERITVVDLRNPAEIRELGSKIAGARILLAEDLSSRSHEIPDDHEVILYCS
ncbi:MAG TPA: VTT domain-containing protein [Bryobacteraceae bacterium]|jgi:membrane protein DedA with SNARE-associated domain|nr:VTT domain-containing protein [Bryobacteraceae bacterium]